MKTKFLLIALIAFLSLSVSYAIKVRTYTGGGGWNDDIQEYTLKSSGQVTANAYAMIYPFESGEANAFIIINNDEYWVHAVDYIGDFDSVTDVASGNFSAGDIFIMVVTTDNGNAEVEMEGDF